MSWLDDMRRVSFGGQEFIGGSFRGVPFFVETVELNGGRRIVVHEFPLRDDPYVDDLGRKARGYRLEAYLLGADYLAQRDKLVDALEREGPGELILPSYGMLRAACDQFTVREGRRDLGLAMVAIEFWETPLQDAPAPDISADGSGLVSASADLATAAAAAEFAESFDPEGLPAFALASAAAAITKASDAIGAALGPLIRVTQEAAEFNAKLAVLTAQAASLVGQPDGIVDAFRSTIVGLAETAASAPGALLDALLDTYAVELGAEVVGTTATRVRELANQTAITSVLRRVIAIEAARLAPLVPYESIGDAMRARGRIAAILDEQAELAGDTAYPSIIDIRSKVLRAVPGANTFARVVTVTRAQPVPSILLAYQLYGSTARELDVVARNKVRHPGFIAGDVEVLSDG